MKLRHDTPGASPAWRDTARALLQQRHAAAQNDAPSPLPTDYFERATCSSFQMDGVPLTAAEFNAAVSRNGNGRSHRSRSAQRARNHVAVLRHIERMLRRGQALQTGDVFRWYTSIACGLSCGGMESGTAGRVAQVVSAVNSPRLRFWPAVKEVAALHATLLADPFVPGFNGILARLTLRYHMGRCGLPAVVFDPVADPPRLGAIATLQPRLLELILANYDGNARTRE